MDLFLTEEDYLPEEFDELPLDEAILRIRETEDDRPHKKKKSKSGKQKSKRPRDDGDNDDGDGSRSGDSRGDGEVDEYDDDDGWLENDLGDDGYDGYASEEGGRDDDDGVITKGGVKVFGEDEAEEVDENGRSKKKKDEKDEEGKEKKPRRRLNTAPRVVLNVDRLKHVNALAALPDILKSMKFKGRGHEEEDLSKIMVTMEHWAHRVMPKMKFGDFIEKVEQLGTKKILKAYVAKIRYNMPLDTIGDTPGKDFDLEELGLNISDEEMLFDDDLPPIPPVNAEDAFDALMKEAEMIVKQRAAAAAATTNTTASTSLNHSNQSPIVRESNASSSHTLTESNVNPQSTSSQINSSQSDKRSSLSEEQRRKIAENARKAAEKRLSLAMERSIRQQNEESITQQSP